MKKTRKTKVRKAKGAKITYGSVSLSDKAFEPEAIRVRLSLMVRGDILNWMKCTAKKQGMPVDTLAEYILRGAYEYYKITGYY